MGNRIQTNQERCVGCNRCVRACPIEAANLTYQDEDGGIKVRVDHEQCISCGACISLCAHDARYYVDDTQAFFDDLAAGAPISLIAAPSVKTNFPQWRQLLAWLRGLGVRKIYDVSLGADICIWAHLRHFEQSEPQALITQPCPAIVTYCEKHRPELLPRLSPVQSPMGCAAVYMRRYTGVEDRIAALSPCIAKGNEFEEIGDIQYNVTFAKLLAYLEEHDIQLPEETPATLEMGGFDHQDAGLGALFPMPGGFRENMEYFLGKSMRIDKAEGRAVYKYLDYYAQTPVEQLPRIYDVLNCAEGCNGGPACAGEQNPFSVHTVMDTSRRATLRKWDDSRCNELFESFDRRLRLDDFLRGYTADRVEPFAVEEADIQRAFVSLDKDTFAKQNYNCGACGSETCREMAKKVALHINIPLNCVVKSRDDAEREHQRNSRLYLRNAEYIDLVRRIGENLLSANDDELNAAVTQALETICTTFHGGITSLWKVDVEDGAYQCRRRYTWPAGKQNEAYSVRKPWPHSWLKAMSMGAHIDVNKAEIEPGLFDDHVRGVRTVPVIIKGDFWGFLAFANDSEQRFAEEEISVVAACGILIVSSILERELANSLITAREQALAGTQAKSDFLSRMSHEMRTPMNAIIGMTKIAGGTDDLDRLHYCLSTIGASSTHLLGLINDVLDMSKIEAGKFTLDKAPFNVEKMLIRICNLIVEKAEENEQKLSIIIGNNMHLHYQGDELRLSQVITNLLSNAVKFTPKGGKITLRVDEQARTDAASVLRVTVSDTGIGMTAEQVSRLFSAFEQADNSITKRFGGTGLGLAISKNIVEKMNGRIWVESVLGQGSEFFFEVELERHTQQNKAVIFDGIKASDLRVLAVDGDEETLAYFSAILTEFGIRADLARNGNDAVDFVSAAYGREQPYDVIFVDYNLPDMSGLKTIECLSRKIDKNTVIIITSFLEWNQIKPVAEEAGVSRFISKPLFPSSVLDAINDVVGQAVKSLEIKANQSKNDSDLSGVRLLLVEDIEINREIFIALLEATRVQIDWAENGEIAVEMFAANPDRYDIIIMDVQMPVMDGYEATRTIRAMETGRSRHMPIVAMTANAFREDIEKCLESGMDDHLTKPIDEAALVHKIAFYTKYSDEQRAAEIRAMK